MMDHLTEWVELPSDVREELRRCAWLVLLAETNLGRPICRRVHCSDASGDGYCLTDSYWHTGDLLDVCRYHERWRFHLDDAEGDMSAEQLATSPSSSPGASSLELWLAAQERGAKNPGRSAKPGWRPDRGVEISAEMAGIQRVPAALLEPSRWRTVVAGAWQRDETIHVLEARTSLIGLFRASRGAAGHGQVHLSLGDNLSSIMAFEKGRAKDPALRRICQRAGAICIAAEMSWRHRHVASEDCVADFGSRLKQRRGLARGVVFTRSAAAALDHARLRAVGSDWKPLDASPKRVFRKSNDCDEPSAASSASPKFEPVFVNIENPLRFAQPVPEIRPAPRPPKVREKVCTSTPAPNIQSGNNFYSWWWSCFS